MDSSSFERVRQLLTGIMGEWNAQKILDKYIHDYMIKKNMHEAAETFAQEANIVDAEVAIDPPEGFLKEWWSLFSDVYNSVEPKLPLQDAATSEDVPQSVRSMLQSLSSQSNSNPLASIPKQPEVNQQQQTTNAMEIPPIPSNPLFPRPAEMNQQALNAMDIPPIPLFPRPAEMNQQALNAMDNPPIPLLPRPAEMNQQALMSAAMAMAISGSGESAINPAANPGLVMPEMPTIYAKMYEQEYLKRKARDLAAKFQPPDVVKIPQMLPSSSTSSRSRSRSRSSNLQATDVSEKIQRGKISQEEIQKPPITENVRQRLARDRQSGINLEAFQAAIEEAATEEVPDAGKFRSVQQIPILSQLLTGVGSSSTAARQQVVISPASAPKQLEQTPQPGGNYQQCYLVEPELQRLEELTLPTLGSSLDLARHMPVDLDTSGRDLHLKGITQKIVQGNIRHQQAPGAQIYKETTILTKQQNSNERDGKRKDLPNVVAVGSSSDRKDPEVEKSLNENIQPHFAHESAWKGFSFKESGSLNSSNNKLLCCHFSTIGRLLAGAGYEKKILLWNMKSLAVEVIDAHSDIITDVRFRPNSTTFATSSFDKTVQVWDASKRKKRSYKLNGHSEHVMSLDFHPRKNDLLCSCDSSNEMRMWNFNKRTCTHIARGAGGKVRFQPRDGDFLASAVGNIINLIDVETKSITNQLKGHVKDVRALCWDTSGKYIASVSEDSARIWTISGGRCVHQLLSSENKFQSCTFHPGYSQLTVLGTNQKLELWNPTAGSRTQSYHAHEGIITALTDSPYTESIASASHDHWIKLWK